jgi:hypothetical protein
MDPEVAGEPEIPEVQHRRRRQSAWQKTPRRVKITVAVCLALVAVSIAAGSWIISWSQKRVPPKANQLAMLPVKDPRITPGKAFDVVASSLPSFDLQLSGTTLNPATRRLEGSVFNKSERAYTNVRITFALPSADLVAQDSTTVAIPKLAPGARAKFVSDALPQGVRQWALINVTAVAPKSSP